MTKFKWFPNNLKHGTQIYTTKYRLAIELTSPSNALWDYYDEKYMDVENCKWGYVSKQLYPTDPIGTIDFNITALS